MIDLTMDVADSQWPPVRPYPIVYFLEPSSICNAACIFCHYPQQRDAGKPIKNISAEDFDSALEFVKADVASREAKTVSLSLTPATGDVLVNPRWGQFLYKMLDLEFADRIDIVTNAILLKQKNIDVLCEAPHKKKLDVGISTGGLDRETYKLMFGTDKFDLVKNNVNALMRTLKERGIKLNVWVNLRVPEASVITQEAMQATYNIADYPWVTFTVLDQFKDVPFANTDDELKVLKRDDTLVPRDFIPCGMLESGALNFGADGRITGCGCHYSQKPGDNSLVLGNMKDSDIKALTKKRVALVQNWRKKNVVPTVCQECQHYHIHQGIENLGLQISPSFIPIFNMAAQFKRLKNYISQRNA